MDFLTDKKFLVLLILLIAFSGGIIMYPQLAGTLLIGALLVFGTLTLVWKEPHIKVAGLIMLVLLAMANIGLNGMKYGIDFSGGTRIPVVLDRSVDQDTMNDLVQTIKKRVSILGLTEAKVRAIGDSEINVEIPNSDPESVEFIERTLAKQGVFQGIVDGQVAVSGDHIFSSSIRPLLPQELVQQGGYSGSVPDWGVSFSVDKEGAQTFASAARGKADYPIYMFLDRPTDAALFYEKDTFKRYIPLDSGERESLNALKDGLALEDSQSIDVYIVEDLPVNFTAPTNDTEAIVSANASLETKDLLESMGFTLVERTDAEMEPALDRSGSNVLFVNSLEAVGLLTAPTLSSGLTGGSLNFGYTITGSVQATDSNAKALEAAERIKSIESILKGGALPVQISLGSRTTLPASLGEEFLRMSILAIGFSLVAIAVVVGLRYRNLRATMPIVLISLAELAILLSILGSFTIDLAAMAGIIAAIGVGVDAQIVITDELLKKDDRKTSEKIELAFGIIKTNATVAIFSMVPLLLFSGLVEVIGFAMSTILGSLLGYMLTRPAYAAIVEKVVEAERRGTPS
jgi:preprotein translocase subunit SecD